MGNDYLPEGYIPPIYQVKDYSDVAFFLLGLVLLSFFFVPMVLGVPMIVDALFYIAGCAQLFYWFVRATEIFRFNRELKKIMKEDLDAERRGKL